MGSFLKKNYVQREWASHGVDTNALAIRNAARAFGGSRRPAQTVDKPRKALASATEQPEQQQQQWQEQVCHPTEP